MEKEKTINAKPHKHWSQISRPPGKSLPIVPPNKTQQALDFSLPTSTLVMGSLRIGAWKLQKD